MTSAGVTPCCAQNWRIVAASLAAAPVKRQTAAARPQRSARLCLSCSDSHPLLAPRAGDCWALVQRANPSLDERVNSSSVLESIVRSQFLRFELQLSAFNPRE
jgi:hypothetical protein